MNKLLSLLQPAALFCLLLLAHQSRSLASGPARPAPAGGLAHAAAPATHAAVVGTQRAAPTRR